MWLFVSLSVSRAVVRTVASASAGARAKGAAVAVAGVRIAVGAGGLVVCSCAYYPTMMGFEMEVDRLR